MFSLFFNVWPLDNMTASVNQILNKNRLPTWYPNMHIFDYVIELLLFPGEEQVNESLCGSLRAVGINTDHSAVDTTLPPCG